MNRAFEDLFGIADAFAGVQMAGRTDKWILEDAATRARVDLTGSSSQRFRHRYAERLLETLPRRSAEAQDALSQVEGRQGVLPGVRPLLEALAAPRMRSDVFLALLTGNCEVGARIKLEHFDLWKFFACGAFGDDAHDRNDLFAVAMAGAEACGVPPVPPQNVIVVGDTVLDVACATVAGARSVAVATGPSDVATLRQSGADVVLEDLSDTAGFLRLLTVQS
jgi:phosphoglycolate phosphatase